MTMKVEFMAGTNLSDAIQEAKDKAEAWDVRYVDFTFNGKKFAIGRNASVIECYQAYHGGADFICQS